MAKSAAKLKTYSSLRLLRSSVLEIGGPRRHTLHGKAFLAGKYSLLSAILYILERRRIVFLTVMPNNFCERTMLPKSSRSEETLLFAKNFLQHPKMLGSLIPSSRFLIDRLLTKVDWTRARTIVEYGPGVGTITAQILARMQPNSRLVVFVINKDFTTYLALAFPH